MPVKLLCRLISAFIISLPIFFLNACATETRDGPPQYRINAKKIRNPVPHPLAKSKYANPRSYVVRGKRYYVLRSSKHFKQRGIASWYGRKFHGRKTSTGERYNMFAMTAASKILPIPTYVRVRNLENGRSVIVKVNDRGPFERHRIIDLSYAAAKKLGYARKGTALVEVDAINYHHHRRPQRHYYAKKSRPHYLHYAQASYAPKLYLQVGVFRHQSNAKRLKYRLQHLTTKPVRIKKSYEAQGQIYHVEIGPVTATGESDKLHHLLRRLGLGEPVTVIS